MPFESQWSRIPLAARWVLCLLVAAALVVLLVVFVSHNNGNGEAIVPKAKLEQESAQDTIIVRQQQAPHTLPAASATVVRTRLERGVAALMRRQVSLDLLPGPVQRVRCWENARRGTRVGYHCSAEADHINYPFLAVYTPSAHRVVFCKKVYAPVASENIPVSRRCRL